MGRCLKAGTSIPICKYQTALPWNTPDTKNNISGTGELQDRWDFFGDPAAFSDLKYAGVPFFAGITNHMPGAGYHAGLAILRFFRLGRVTTGCPDTRPLSPNSAALRVGVR